jgi:hypothetical protein
MDEEDEAFDELDRRINRVLEHWTPLTPMTQAEIVKHWGSWMTMYVRMVEEAHGICHAPKAN